MALGYVWTYVYDNFSFWSWWHPPGGSGVELGKSNKSLIKRDWLSARASWERDQHSFAVSCDASV